MDLSKVQKRRQFFRQQLRELIKAENQIKIQEALFLIRDYYAELIGKRFDPVLSAKIDCLTWLLEN